jgi:succinate dehydrogenase / fumarate reductase membrane anchor subunit
MNIRTPIAHVKHLGAARSGTEHFMRQRITAIILLPLMVWFVTSVIFFFKESEVERKLEWVSSPFNASFFILFIGMVLYHGYLGMQMIIEDYVHNKLISMLLIILLQVLCLLSFIAACLGFTALHFLSNISFS